jgi:beta-glucanase (GH16 family)
MVVVAAASAAFVLRRESPVASGGTLVVGTAAADAPDDVVFEDGFDDSSLSSRRWTPCHWWADGGCTIASNDELQWYLPSQATTSDGVLRLEADAARTVAPDGRVFPYRSAMVSTGPSDGGDTGARFAFRYGIVEARVRVPEGGGLWPAVWMLPLSMESKPEIDLMEVKGSATDVVHMNAHLRNADGEWRWIGGDWSGTDMASGWHVLTLDWRPGSLRWLVDGQERFAVSGASVPDEPMYLVMNLAVGGSWPGPVDPSTEFPTAFEIDHVRVSRLP